MSPEQLKSLKDYRKKYVCDSVINYGGAFVEHKKFEKGIWVKPKDGEDHVLEYLKRFDKEYKYNFNQLPKAIQNYFLFVDEVLYQKEYRQHDTNLDDAIKKYEKMIEKAEKVNGRELTYEETLEIIEGKKIRYEDTTFKKLRRSVNRAYGMIQAYSRCNTDVFKYFVTFTFAQKENASKHQENGLKFKYCDNPKNYADCYACLVKWLDVMKKEKQKRGIVFEYLITYEKQKNGNYHYHALMSDIPDELIIDTPDPLDLYRGEKAYGKSLKNWKYGKSDIQEIRDKEKITTYVSKYIVKTLYDMKEADYFEFLNQRKYYPSNGLSKPTVEYYDYLPDDFNAKKEGSYSEKYETQYCNPYNDSHITRVVYSKASTDLHE